MYIIDKRPNKGKLVELKQWATTREIPPRLTAEWLTRYDFPIIKIDAVKFAYEEDLDKCLQKHIEGQELSSIKRRAEIRNKAAFKREAVREYLKKLQQGGGL